MSDVAIKIEGLGKRYRIGAKRRHDQLREAAADFFRSGWRRFAGNAGADDANLIWALKDISLEIKCGEIIGVIGRNGAGKSTLLKILSRVTEPTTGRIEIAGRVGSLLEVGTGFHPELTGRENIFLNGAILGMSRSEIKSKFDEIVAFSEIEKFIDTPVKHYSSGMYVRLAFAVAAHLEPEILLVDEVLAVGDAAFQRKCLGKMGDVTKEGRTVLFVSHNMVAVQKLCENVIWINSGEIVEMGGGESVVSSYFKASDSGITMCTWNEQDEMPGNEKVRICSACVRPENGGRSDEITLRTPISIEFEYLNFVPDSKLNLSLHVYNNQGIIVFNTAPIGEPKWHGKAFPVGLFRSVCHIPGDLLNDGTHSVELLVVKDQGVVIYRHDAILMFNVLDDPGRRGDWNGRWAGVVRPIFKWETELIEKNTNNSL